MTLTLSDVNRIANLSYIELTEIEKNKILEKLNNIFALIETIKTVDTTNVKPLDYPILAFDKNLSSRLRDDSIIQVNHRGMYHQLTSVTTDNLYLVPKVIE